MNPHHGRGPRAKVTALARRGSDHNNMYEFQSNILGIAVGIFILNDVFPFQTCNSIELRDIFSKEIFVPWKYNLPVRENSWGKLLN